MTTIEELHARIDEVAGRWRRLREMWNAVAKRRSEINIAPISALFIDVEIELDKVDDELKKELATLEQKVLSSQKEAA